MCTKNANRTKTIVKYVVPRSADEEVLFWGLCFNGVLKELSQIVVNVVMMCSLLMLDCSFRQQKLNFSATKDTKYVLLGSDGLGGLELVGRWHDGGEEKIRTSRVSPHAVRWPQNFFRVSILVSIRSQWRCSGLRFIGY